MQQIKQLLSQSLPSIQKQDKRNLKRNYRQRSESPYGAKRSKKRDQRYDEESGSSSSSENDSDQESKRHPSSTTSTLDRRSRVESEREKEDSFSVHADPIEVGKLVEDAGDKSATTSAQNQEVQPTENSENSAGTSQRDKGEKVDQGPVLEDPHAKPKGEVFVQSVLDWWKSQRTNILTTEKKEEFLGSLKPDQAIASFFKAPDLPDSVREKLKQMRISAWKDDNSLWSIQEDLLKASLPLVKALEELQKKGETNRLLSSTGSLMGSVVQRLSMYRLRHAETVFKGGFLKDVSPSMTCLLGDNWTEQVEQEDKVNKVTQKVVKPTFKESSQTGKQFSKRKGKPFNKGKGHGKFNKYRKGKHFNSNADANGQYSGYDHDNQGRSSFRDFSQTQDQSRFQKDFKEKKAYRPGSKN